MNEKPRILSAFQGLDGPPSGASEAAGDRPAAPLVFDACQVGVILRAVLAVEALSAVAVMFEAGSAWGWLARFSVVTGAVLPATLAWLIAACSLKRPLARLGIAGQYLAGALLGAIAGLYGCGLLVVAGFADHHHDRAADRSILLYGLPKSFLGEVLDAHVQGENDFLDAVLPGVLVEFLPKKPAAGVLLQEESALLSLEHGFPKDLHALQTLRVHSGEADHVRSQFPKGIIPAPFPLHPDPGQSQARHFFRLLNRQLPGEPDKGDRLLEFFQKLPGIQTEVLGKNLSRPFRVLNLGRMGKKRARFEAYGKKIAPPIHDLPPERHQLHRL
jgi:hypothetical protein